MIAARVPVAFTACRFCDGHYENFLRIGSIRSRDGENGVEFVASQFQHQRPR